MIQCRPACVRLALVLGCSLLPAVAPVAFAGPPKPIALTGTDGPYGPQLGTGVHFVTFSTADLLSASPALNSAGRAAFLARLAGTGISSANDTGVWVESDAGLRLAARTGNFAPGTDPGVAFSGFYTEPMLDASGRTAFKAIIVGPGVDNTTNDGLWSEGLGTMRLVIQEHVTPAPGGGGVLADPGNYGWPTPTMWGNNPMVMNNGKIAQRSYLTPGLAPWNLHGVWTDRSGSLDYFIRADQEPVPGYPGSYFFVVGNPTMNASGAMIAMTARANPPSSDVWGVWSDRSGTLAKIVEAGDAVPGIPGGAWHDVADTSINAQGRIALLADIDGLGAFPVLAVFSDARFGVLQLIARYGAIAPGAGTGAFWGMTTPVISNNGVTAFYGRLIVNPPVTEATAKGIWSNRLPGAGGGAGSLALVVRSGDPAAGLPGVTYADFFAPVINAQGEVAFIATLSDGIGLFRQNAATGVVELVVRDFDVFDVFGNGSDIRLVTGLATPEVSGNPHTSAGTGDGRRAYFNDDGDLAFRLTFSDGSEGIFNTSSHPCVAVSITQQPVAMETCPAGSGVFSVVAGGTAPAYQWQRETTPNSGSFVNLADGPTASWDGGAPGVGAIVSGSSTDTLSIVADLANARSLTVAHAVRYRCALTNACTAGVSSDAAQLTVCYADYNCDGFMDGIDYDQFNNDFESYDPVQQMNADYNGDGFVDGIDYDLFMNDFETGCV